MMIDDLVYCDCAGNDIKEGICCVMWGIGTYGIVYKFAFH